MQRIYLILLILFSCFNTTQAQETFITTSDSVKLYVHVKGEGTPCLFVHGGPGQGSNYWEKLAGDFCEKEYQMIYVDQRGCGRSTSPEDNNYSPERMIQDFEEIREELNIDQWVVMGHSFAGILQTLYASQHPDKIHYMLMFNCTLNLKKSLEGSYLPAVSEFLELGKGPFLLNQKLPLSERLDSMQQLFSTKEDVWKLSFATIESAIKFSETYRGFEKWNTDFRDYVFQNTDYMKDFTLLSQNITVPVLYFYGKSDINIGKDHYLDLQFPKLKLYSTEGGHMEFIHNERAEYIRAIKMAKTELTVM